MLPTGPYKKLIKYKVKAEKAQENIEYVQSMFRALESSKPEELRYVAFQLEDGLSFLHIAIIESDDGYNPLHPLEEFKAFSREISSRCEELPSFSMLTTLGNYRVFG